MVTAVLLKYKRPIEAIKRHLESIPEITQVVVWDNTCANIMCFGRYLAALESENDTIYTQDDDCIVNNILELISAYNGTSIISAMKPWHIKAYAKHPETLMGWGSVFSRKWIRVFNRYISQYGIDNILLREADRIFTGLNRYTVTEADIRQLDCERDDNAMFLDDCHKESVREARERIGWVKATENRST